MICTTALTEPKAQIVLAHGHQNGPGQRTTYQDDVVIYETRNSLHRTVHWLSENLVVHHTKFMKLSLHYFLHNKQRPLYLMLML